jgi:hypothetical protein
VIGRRFVPPASVRSPTRTGTQCAVIEQLRNGRDVISLAKGIINHEHCSPDQALNASFDLSNTATSSC